jgi:hypothetical protein
VTPTLRRSRDDIFLIGEEELLEGQEGGGDPDPTIASGDLGGRSCRRGPRSPHLPGPIHGARGLAALGLGAGALALLAALELGGGEGPDRPPAGSSPRSPLISRSAASAPAMPAVRHHRQTARPAEVHRPRVAHHRHPRPSSAPEPSRPPITRTEPEREPTPQVAPVSSSAVTATAPAPAAAEAPAASAPKTPSPGPPPSSSGGGPVGVESFGFER